MLPEATIAEIERLLGEGQLSQRKIAAQLGVGRGTVNAIARGKRRPRVRRSPARPADIFNPELPPERCPGCGALVQMPCVLCRTRRYAAERRGRRGSAMVRRVA